MPTYKLQVQADEKQPQLWEDVKSGSGELLLFNKEADARTRLMELFPVLVKMEQYAAGPKRTRVVVVNPYQDIDDSKEE